MPPFFLRSLGREVLGIRTAHSLCMMLACIANWQPWMEHLFFLCSTVNKDNRGIYWDWWLSGESSRLSFWRTRGDPGFRVFWIGRGLSLPKWKCWDSSLMKATTAFFLVAYSEVIQAKVGLEVTVHLCTPLNSLMPVLLTFMVFRSVTLRFLIGCFVPCSKNTWVEF